jgi:hypothetical protein
MWGRPRAQEIRTPWTEQYIIAIHHEMTAKDSGTFKVCISLRLQLCIHDLKRPLQRHIHYAFTDKDLV